MINNPHILIVDDNQARIHTIRLALPDIGPGVRVSHASDMPSLLSCIAGNAPGIVLCTSDSASLTLPLVKQVLVEQAGRIPLIAYTDVFAKKTIVELIRQGASDVADFLKSEHIALVTATHLDAVDQLRTHWRLREEPDGSSDAIARSNEHGSRDQWKQKLLQAVKEQRFSLSEQRISSLHIDPDGKASDREHIDILLRLNIEGETSETRLPAARFLTEARKAGLSPLIDIWVIEQSCRQLKQLHEGGRNTELFVRLEPSTVNGSKLANFIDKSISHFECSADGLVFELPQESFEKLSESAIQQLHAVRALGCKLSMSYCGLKRPYTAWPEGLTPQYVKLSPKELSRLNGQQESIDSLTRVVELMHKANIQVIAPQVEHADALAMFWSAGVDFAQGFYHSCPTVVLASNAA